MDVKLQVSGLREQSEQLLNLATALNTDLRKLEWALSAQEGTSDPKAIHLLVGIGALNSSLSSATDLLCQRLHQLLNSAHISNGLPA